MPTPPDLEPAENEKAAIGFGSLALVLDDPLAPKLIAWWRAAEPAFADFEKDEDGKAAVSISRLASLLQAGSDYELERTIDRCKVAGLIFDGGVSKDAKIWLNHLVAQRLGYKPQPVKPKKAPKPKASK